MSIQVHRPPSFDSLSSEEYEVAASTDTLSVEGLPVGLATMIRDESGYRIGLFVEELGDENALEMVLEVEEHIRWWKSLSYFMAVQGGRGVGQEIRIETRNTKKRSTQYLYLPDLTSMGIFELWKGGFGGFGAFAGSLPINAYANANRRIIFHWYED